MERLKPFNENWKKYLVLGLVLSNLFVWTAVDARAPGDVLSLYFLDVGQGDAILIDSPSRGRILIDGGRNRQVLSELGKVLPFGDRRIDVVIATHPDADHIGGLPEVLARHKISVFMESGVDSNNSISDVLYSRLEEGGVHKMTARRGHVINFGDGVRLVILFPNQNVTIWAPNDASVVAKLSYGEHSFLLTGDATFRTENILLNIDEQILNADVLQAGHHGSRTSTSLSFAEAVSPEYTVISAGKNNSYGHPHKEVLNVLEQVGAIILGTYDKGTITFKTDGKILKLK